MGIGAVKKHTKDLNPVEKPNKHTKRMQDTQKNKKKILHTITICRLRIPEESAVAFMCCMEHIKQVIRRLTGREVKKNLKAAWGIFKKPPADDQITCLTMGLKKDTMTNPQVPISP